VKLIVGYAHKYGPGKTHIRGRMGILGYETLCGMSIHGHEENGKKVDVTCKKCIRIKGW
jgi:hypothetical protein